MSPANLLNSNVLARGLCKPGHWICESWPDMKANLGDFQGELQTESSIWANQRVPLSDMPYDVQLAAGRACQEATEDT